MKQLDLHEDRSVAQLMADGDWQDIALLVADPPWPFKDKLPGNGRGAAKHYGLMSVEDICTMQRPPCAKDAVLFLWRVASQPQAALDVARAWGFVPKAELVWIKTTSTGKLHFGMGRSVRSSHETCIIATRGRPVRLRADVRSVFYAPVPVVNGKRVHSAKPEAFFDIAESMYDGPRAELFARRRRLGWYCLGNELEASCEVQVSSASSSL